ncbi:type I-B CRISPR-associated protein Cas7/Cst2/DevR [Microbispora triticiradicis]|uniref:type I-B CRISPR-associated protein Cas7/Cst2/DevR n=1 Tax=Microbispora triticiradicis TaxID=2200763 RepID=UPI001AD6DD3A|nr:type I-B CRISPR-associated protein Cas7/Cst2/DevR [Microbispora triticiradicis]MBO4270954.1 type I-B CRISPR-associated protein Cas7/Cst2/DevR [Microbispora triticiradicis]
MSYLVGKVVLDIVAGAPNNGLGEDNVARVKQLRVGRDVHPYVSAQAFRRWLRDSLPSSEPASPVIRSGSGQKQQAYTKGRPDLYLDDDLFGYMVAVKNDKAKTCQRDTVLATGTFVSVAPRAPERDFGTMSRGFSAGENPVLHGHEFYSAELAGDVLLDLPRVGVFEIDGSGLEVALPEPAAKEARERGAEPVTFRGGEALRLPVEERRRRAALLLRTLAAVRGGAKQSMHYGDRTPALVLLAPLKGGINPFTRVLGVRNGRARFDSAVLRAEMQAWADELDGPVMLGWAPGFLGDQRDQACAELADLIATDDLVVDHPRILLGRLAEQIERGERDTWFEDPKA